MQNQQPEKLVLPTDGVDLAVNVRPARGRSRGRRIRALILVHGFAGTKSENGLFDHLAADLADDGYSVYCYDARGLGESTGDFARTSLDTHVEDFRSFAAFVTQRENLEVSQTCAVGFSLGACVIGLAVQAGYSPGAVVYLSPATRPALSMGPRYSTQEIMDCLARSGVYLKPDNQVALGKTIIDALTTTDLGDRCFDIGIPLLVCHGTADSRIPIEHTLDALATSSGRQTCFREFAGASHSFKPADRHWHELSACLRGWLASGELLQPGLQVGNGGANVSAESPAVRV